MSSQVLSPHTPNLGLEESPSGSRTRRAKAYPTRRLAATLTSPVPTNASSSTTHSTRSRTRQSRSPEKKATSELSRASTRTRRSRASDESHVSARTQDEEGESEIDPDADVPSASLSIEEQSSGDEKKTPVTISLRLGRKRKASVMEEDGNDDGNDDGSDDGNDDGNESELTPEAEERSSPVKQTEAEEQVEEEVEEEVVDKADDDYGLPKRAPRKKRKWLKKGEVDPDDPIAVAKQKERHALIDEALLLLDKQLEMIENETHPQLTWMLEELERRYKRNVSQVEAKQEAVLQDLERMRTHDKQQATFNWTCHRDNLVDTMTAEVNLKLGRIEQERNSLKRRPNDYPNMREGRGGGGWKTYDDHLLSKHKEQLVRVEHGSGRVRKAVSLDVKGIGNHAAQAELAKMLSKPRSPSPPRHQRRVSTSRPDEYSRIYGPEVKKPAPKPSYSPWAKYAEPFGVPRTQYSPSTSRPSTQLYPATATPSTAQYFPPRVKSMFGEPIGGVFKPPPKPRPIGSQVSVDSQGRVRYDVYGRTMYEINGRIVQ